MPLSALKFHFFTNYLFFRRNYANTYTNPNTIRFSYPCLKNALHTFFLKLPFFCSLLLLLTDETLSNHLFRQTSDQKGSKNLKIGGKFFFFFFYNFFHIFPLPLRKKAKPLTFSALFIIGNRKSTRKNVP